MRLIFWGLVVIAICYMAYAAMMSVWAYFVVAGTIDEVLPMSADPRDIHGRIVKGANDSGVPLQEREVVVTRDERGQVRVEVVWTFPVVVYKGESVLAVPMSVKRTKLETNAAPARR